MSWLESNNVQWIWSIFVEKITISYWSNSINTVIFEILWKCLSNHQYISDFPQNPHSVCSKSCGPGFRNSPQQGKAPCCFDCIPCSENEISNGTGKSVTYEETPTRPKEFPIFLEEGKALQVECIGKIFLHPLASEMTQRITLTFETAQPIYHDFHIWFIAISIVCITFSRKHLPPLLSMQFSSLSWNLGEILWKNTFLFVPHSEYMVLAHVYFLSACQNAWQRPSVQKIFVWFKG
jgi:hypothetical protein